MKVTMLLADSVQAVGGKLYILGGGWSITGPPTPSGIAILIEVPWDQTNRKHPWKPELLDSDGEPVMLETPVGEQPPPSKVTWRSVDPPDSNRAHRSECPLRSTWLRSRLHRALGSSGVSRSEGRRRTTGVSPSALVPPKSSNSWDSKAKAGPGYGSGLRVLSWKRPPVCVISSRRSKACSPF